MKIMQTLIEGAEEEIQKSIYELKEVDIELDYLKEEVETFHWWNFIKIHKMDKKIEKTKEKLFSKLKWINELKVIYTAMLIAQKNGHDYDI